MKFVRLAVVVAIVAGWTATASADFTMDEWLRMKEGEVLLFEEYHMDEDGNPLGQFATRVYIKADRKTVWNTVRDYEHYPEFMPRIVDCTILKEEGQVLWVRHDIKILWFEVTFHLRVEGVELYRRIEWVMDRSRKNNIRDTTGYWLLEDAPDGSGTILTYSPYIDPGIPGAMSLARTVAKRSLPAVVKNVRLRVESGGTWKKPKGS